MRKKGGVARKRSGRREKKKDGQEESVKVRDGGGGETGRKGEFCLLAQEIQLEYKSHDYYPQNVC